MGQTRLVECGEILKSDHGALCSNFACKWPARMQMRSRHVISLELEFELGIRLGPANREQVPLIYGSSLA
jgi:hypothetical protein